jgi:limonene-1,2-epoxide hydrolase
MTLHESMGIKGAARVEITILRMEASNQRTLAERSDRICNCSNTQVGNVYGIG